MSDRIRVGSLVVTRPTWAWNVPSGLAGICYEAWEAEGETQGLQFLFENGRRELLNTAVNIYDKLEVTGLAEEFSGYRFMGNDRLDLELQAGVFASAFAKAHELAEEQATQHDLRIWQESYEQEPELTPEEAKAVAHDLAFIEQHLAAVEQDPTPAPDFEPEP